jgi:hypothetical protein
MKETDLESPEYSALTVPRLNQVRKILLSALAEVPSPKHMTTLDDRIWTVVYLMSRILHDFERMQKGEIRHRYWKFEAGKELQDHIDLAEMEITNSGIQEVGKQTFAIGELEYDTLISGEPIWQDLRCMTRVWLPDLEPSCFCQ